MSTLQEIMQATNQLTIDEKKTLTEFLAEQSQHDEQSENYSTTQIDAKFSERPDMVRKLEREWLQQNWREYLGQWVAIEGDKLLSSSNDGKIVFAAARAAGIRVPFVIHVQDPTLPQMGGW